MVILITTMSVIKVCFVLHSAWTNNTFITPLKMLKNPHAIIVHYTHHEVIKTYLGSIFAFLLLFCGKEDHESLKQREHNK